MSRRIEWSAPARASLLRLGRPQALSLMERMGRMLSGGEGDVRYVRFSEPREYRLRVGEYRVRFRDVEDALQVLTVRNWREG